MTGPGRLAAAAAVAVGLLLAAAPAGADPAPPAGGGSTTTSSAPGANLGGFQTTAEAAGLRTTYEQPNFPVPATPTLEGNIGYSSTSYEYGPTGESTASTLYPGQVAAGFGSQLNTLVDPYLQPYFGNATPNVNAGPWPLQAATAYPQGPDSASQDSAGVAEDAASGQDQGTASASLGTAGGTQILPGGLVSVQWLGSTVDATVDAQGEAVSQATSAVHGISIAGGLLTIGTVTSTATATSDGNQGQVSGTSTASDVTVAGQAVTLDGQGLEAGGQSTALSPATAADQALSAAGITVSLTTPTDTVDGPSAARVLQGVQVTIDLSQLDAALNQGVAGLPAQVRQQLIEQLPLPVPDGQTLEIDLGWTSVAAAASPGYDTSDDSANTGDTSGSAGDATSDTGGLGPGSLDAGTGDDSALGTTGGTGSPAGATSSGAAQPSAAAPVAAAAEPAAVFRGIGAGLLALGGLLAAALAALLLRAERAVGAAGTAAHCPDET